jgi:TonB family protein
MLAMLLESHPVRTRTHFGTAASATIHLLLISTAAFMTVATKTEDEPPVTPVRLHWGKLRHVELPVHTSSPAPIALVSSEVRAPSISVAIPANIPDVSIPLSVVRNDDFFFASGRTATSGVPAAAANPVERPVYDHLEVDETVAVIPGIAPVYPAAMRAAGIEGEVNAAFVVDAKGRADVSSLKIISSTNDQFTRAVRDALPQMRFKAARLLGRAVPQMVQQSFAFRLNR